MPWDWRIPSQSLTQLPSGICRLWQATPDKHSPSCQAPKVFIFPELSSQHPSLGFSREGLGPRQPPERQPCYRMCTLMAAGQA